MVKILLEYNLLIFQCCFKYTVFKFINANKTYYAAVVEMSNRGGEFEIIQSKVLDRLSDAKKYLLELNEFNFRSDDIDELNEFIQRNRIFDKSNSNDAADSGLLFCLDKKRNICSVSNYKCLK